ncbi:FGGY-family carbohydrate kinase [Lacisediminihabitans sp. FW035]
MLVYAVDIGTTNLKTVLYDEQLRPLATAFEAARYTRTGERVEFDPSELFDRIVSLIADCAVQVGGTHDHDVIVSLTGQAESLVLTDREGVAVRPAMSWLDERAADEADTLGDLFGEDAAFAVTGEPFPSTTWPASKMLWLRRHEPTSLTDSAHVLMVKDYVVQRLTGLAMGEVTTRGFTYFWDVRQRTYWDAMLDVCGIPDGTLPEVVPAGADLGRVTSAVADLLPAARSYRVNSGALDHFCAMVGTGSYAPGVVSESAGTVLSLSMLVDDWDFDAQRKVSFHAGLRPGETILFNGADSGGVALEWFRQQGLGGMPFAELERRLRQRSSPEAPIFLPYLTGVNPPDFLAAARGAFLGLDLSHDRIDMAFAVEEGIAHLLRRNIDYLTPAPVNEIVSTGGGAESTFWSQLKADVCGVDVVVPEEREATCRGAAALALVAAGVIDEINDVASLNPPSMARFPTTRSSAHEARYGLFESYLNRLYGG